MLETIRQRSILKACLDRQPNAWEAFLDDYLPLVHQVVISVESQMGFSDPSAETLREDVLAGVMTVLIEKDFAWLRKFRGESGLDTYLVVVTRRLALDLWRSEIKRASEKNIQSKETYPSEAEEMGSQTLSEVESMLGKLRPLEREAARLHYLEGCSPAEVARQLKVPTASICPLLARARRKIQGSVEKS